MAETTVDVMRFGSYEVTDKPLGQGAMGVVYKARHTVLGTTACVKVLQPKYTQHADVARRFINEGIAAAGLKNEHIVGVLDCAQTTDGAWYIVLDYIRGLSLGAWMRGPNKDGKTAEHHGVMPRRMVGTPGAVDHVQTLHLMMQVADALHAAHEAGIVHRDVKPDNIMLSVRPGNPLHAIVVDFGIAKLRSPDGIDLTKSTAYLGTPAYMAPEQFGSAKYVNRRTDVYALGGMLYKLLTGGFYAWADDNNEIQSTEWLYHRQVSEPPPDPRTRNSAVTPALVELVRWSLTCDPVARCPSALVFAQALATAMLEAGVAPGEVARAWTLVPALQDAASGVVAATGPSAGEAVEEVLWRPPVSTAALSRAVPRELVASPQEATRNLRPPPPEPVDTTLGSASGESQRVPVVGVAVLPAGGRLPTPVFEGAMPVARSSARRRLVGVVAAASAAAVLVVVIVASKSGGGATRAGAPDPTAAQQSPPAPAATPGPSPDPAAVPSAPTTTAPPPAPPTGAPGPSAATASVTIVTEPTGATVIIDDQPVGPAPATASLAIGRTVRVRAELLGHAPLDQLYLVAAQPSPLRLVLVPTPASGSAKPGGRAGGKTRSPGSPTGPKPGDPTLDRIAD